MWDSHIEGAQESASEQVLIVTSVGPTANVARTRAIAQLLNEERLVHLPSLSSNDG